MLVSGVRVGVGEVLRRLVGEAVFEGFYSWEFVVGVSFFFLGERAVSVPVRDSSVTD